uniref:Transmembrane protein 79a n=1 Tax=Poecilia formosa TaxID=48698 RepID=A0A087X9R4_POEFO
LLSACVTMSTSGLQATDRQNVKELDTVKESISDIINQLQDIDPARLSFSPFLDLDTQISLAPVSDSPESSVEELRSASHSASGSQRSLEPPPAATAQSRKQQEEPDQTLSSPIITSHSLDTAMENCMSPPPPASQGDIPNGTNTPRWSPESTTVESPADEGRPLIGPPRESVELAVWSTEGFGETDGATGEALDQGRCCCRCKCSQSARLPAILSVLASLLCAAGMLYALYFYVPIRPPDCPDISCRIIFTFCCCAVAALPMVLEEGTVGHPKAEPVDTETKMVEEPTDRRHTVQQLFVSSSLEQLLLYVLNLVVMAALLPQEQLKLVPILVVMFIIGRLVFWFSLNTCGSWRGFGSGLTSFPLLAVVALNLFLMYNLNLKQPLFGPQDVLYNQVTPSSWSGETSQSPSGKPDVLPTDILDAQ